MPPPPPPPAAVFRDWILDSGATHHIAQLDAAQAFLHARAPAPTAPPLSPEQRRRGGGHPRWALFARRLEDVRVNRARWQRLRLKAWRRHLRAVQGWQRLIRHLAIIRAHCALLTSPRINALADSGYGSWGRRRDTFLATARTQLVRLLRSEPRTVIEWALLFADSVAFLCGLFRAAAVILRNHWRVTGASAAGSAAYVGFWHLVADETPPAVEHLAPGEAPIPPRLA